MTDLFTLVEYIKKYSWVKDVQVQSTTPLHGEGQVIVLRVYTDDDKPPDLGVRVRDGVGVKLEHGK